MPCLLPGASSLTRGIRPVVRLRPALPTLSEMQNLTELSDGDIHAMDGIRSGHHVAFDLPESRNQQSENQMCPSPEWFMETNTFTSPVGPRAFVEQLQLKCTGAGEVIEHHTSFDISADILVSVVRVGTIWNCFYSF